jgi:hypothetical protein
VNGDGRINETDAVLVLVHLGRANKGSRRFDVNGDGRVNLDDLLRVLRCKDSSHHRGHGYGHHGWDDEDDR